jgi:hypothetical protein
MPAVIKKVFHQRVVAEGGTAPASRIVKTLTEAGVPLLAISAGPSGVELFTDDQGAIQRVADTLGWTLSAAEPAFLIQSQVRTGVMGSILGSLAEAQIPVTALEAISAGEGRFGALLRVEQGDVDRAAEVLHVSPHSYTPPFDTVDESSEESFPSSDSPAWILPAPQ